MKLATIAAFLVHINAAYVGQCTAQRHGRHLQRWATHLPLAPAKREHIQEDDPNWAGAILTGTNFTSVTANFIVPEPTLPPNASNCSVWGAAIWVGIDGYLNSPLSLWQAGIEVNLVYVKDSATCDLDNEAGTFIYYSAWYEWWPYPQIPWGVGTFNISAGDNITISLTTGSTHNSTTGTAMIENFSTGQILSVNDSDHGVSPLYQTSAEWIVEDYTGGDGQYEPFVDFGTVLFTNASATSLDRAVGLEDAIIADIQLNGTDTVATDVVVLDDHTVKVWFNNTES
jgi:hypothetical protein